MKTLDEQTGLALLDRCGDRTRLTEVAERRAERADNGVPPPIPRAYRRITRKGGTNFPLSE